MLYRNLKLLLLALLPMAVWGQEEVNSITIEEDAQTAKTSDFRNCRLMVLPMPSTNENEVKLNIEMENTSDYYQVLLGRSFTEKDLKKRHLCFHKKFYGEKSRKSKGLGEDVDILKVDPDDHTTLTFTVAKDGTTPIKLYVYSAEHKKKKFLSKEKYIVLQGDQLTLNVTVESKNDETLARFTEEYDDILEDLRNVNFCTNRNHRPKLERQQEPYRERIDKLLDDIADVKKQNRWRDSDKKYEAYKELKEKLEAIDLDDHNRDCGRHSPTPPRPNIGHQCTFCNYTPAQAYAYMERIYRQLYGGKIDRSTAKSRAGAIKSCPKIQGNNKMDEYYNRIMNF